ncbi:hypothetical protein DFH28DRAFT_1078987 [Melampsora americana]|nr:hypothetical protein DFH28DRAFT_1078987 [Melampsora americana]
MRRSIQNFTSKPFKPTRNLRNALQPIHHHRQFFTRSNPTSNPIITKFIKFSKLTGLLITLIGSSIYLSDTRAGLHSWFGVPLIKALASQDPEESHQLAIKLLKFLGIHHLIQDKGIDGDQLKVELWGKKFSNPIGIAAGFDKHGDAIDGLFDIGFGYVEIGSITPEAQAGNPKPRMFRLPSTHSIINRYGFNSEEAQPIRSLTTPLSAESLTSGYPLPQILEKEVIPLDDRLCALVDDLDLPRSLRDGKVLGVNLGKNKWSAPDSIEDFILGIQRFGPLTDVLVINVSSPNTPGLRNLQSKSIFQELLFEMVKSRNELRTPQNGKEVRPALLVKVAPDLSYQELALQAGIDGIIVSNTTIARPPQAGSDLSINEPLKPLALRALSTIYTTTEGKIPLIGCGGISNGKDVIEYGRAGASLVQLYTSFTYEGIGLPRKIKDEVKEILKGKDWNEIIGMDAIREDPIERGIEEVKERLRFVEGKVKEYVERSERKNEKRFSEAQFAVPRSTSTSSGTLTGFTSQNSRSISSSSSNSLTPSTETQILSKPFTSSQSSTSSSSSSSSSSIPNQTIKEHQEKKEESVGILSDWKLKRSNEIKNGDCKRVV